MSYGWIITRDCLDSGPKMVTGDPYIVMGPRNISDEHKRLLATSLRKAKVDGTHRFRLYDDDGELYYEGRYVGDPDSEEAFGPLEDYGSPNAGCVRIDYLGADGLWATL